jgi:hypothetical protein
MSYGATPDHVAENQGVVFGRFVDPREVSYRWQASVNCGKYDGMPLRSSTSTRNASTQL